MIAIRDIKIRYHRSRHALSAGFGWALTAILATAMMGSLYAGSPRSMTTVHYNNEHTGWNQDETDLTIKTVNRNQFGQLWTQELVGQIYASPLYVGGLSIKGQVHNVVYAVTEANFIFALDADTGEQLWADNSLGVPGASGRPFLLCGNISPNVGITSTPVIDLDTNTLYAVGLTRRGFVQEFKITAVDIRTGEPKSGWPVTIDPSSDVPLDTRVTSNRGALLLANGMVYVPFGGYAGDCGNYHGWVVGVDKENPAAPQISYRTPGTEEHKGSGLWASAGISADMEGNLYPVTGNSFNAPELDFSNAVLRLRPDLSFSEQPEDFFMPSNWEELNPRDIDLGSVAAMLLPRQDASNTPNMIFVAGKAGVGHLLNRDNLGGVATGDGTNGEGIFSAKLFNRVYSTGVYYADPEVGPTIFVAGRGQGEQPGCEDTVNGVVALTLDVEGDSSYHSLWCTPSMGILMDPKVTSGPDQTGILWVLDRQAGPARMVLHALNAVTGEELYNSDMVEGDALGDSASTLIHFTVIDGKVFVGDRDGNLVAFGLRR